MREFFERRGKPRRRIVRFTGPVWVTLENVSTQQKVNAKLVDTSETGYGVETQVALKEGTVVLILGHDESLPGGSVRARVVRCNGQVDSSYRVGLAIEQTKETRVSSEVSDFYEVLQVNPKADPDTIHRVYRLLAQRYHPDNAETGNPETFQEITKVYKVLNDPEKRASYDAQLLAYRQSRSRVFDPTLVGTGKQAEKQKRRAILELLYSARLNNTASPSMNSRELEDLVGCPREHLEFPLWYLRENGWIAKGDNGRFTITAKGVDQAEAYETAPTPKAKLLTAGA